MLETPAGTQMAPESLRFFLMQPTHGNKMPECHRNGWLYTKRNIYRQNQVGLPYSVTPTLAAVKCAMQATVFCR
jgi:hypothetical protein